jgi:hypothetical protein
MSELPDRTELPDKAGTDTPDGIERTAVLKGKRLDVKEGRRVTVTGTFE